MKINEILSENNSNFSRHRQTSDEKLDEGWKSALGALGMAGAMALGSGAAHGRVSGDEQNDPGINRLTGKPITTQVTSEPGSKSTMPYQNLDSAEKVEKTADGITIHHGGETYNAIEVPKDSPTPRGAKIIKVQQAQLGIRGIGNYITYLLPNGKAYIYSK